MPVIVTTKKALRQSIRKAAINKPIRSKARTLAKKAIEDPSEEATKLAYSAVDKAAKRNIYHSNTASRIKSRIARSLAASQKAK